MKYLLMLNAPRGTGDWDVFKWPRKDIEAHVAYWDSLNHELRAAGELVGVEALSAPAEAKRVRADKNGLPVTDGVFPETKEFLAGYWIDRRRQRRARLRDRCQSVDGAGTGGQAVAHGARGASGDASFDVGRVTSTQRPRQAGCSDPIGRRRNHHALLRCDRRARAHAEQGDLLARLGRIVANQHQLAHDTAFPRGDARRDDGNANRVTAARALPAFDDGREGAFDDVGREQTESPRARS